MAGGGKLFKINIDVCRGISPYLKSCSLVTFHLNVLKLGKVDNSVMLFHVVDHVIVVSFTNAKQ